VVANDCFLYKEQTAAIYNTSTVCFAVNMFLSKIEAQYTRASKKEEKNYKNINQYQNPNIFL
jgi:hypothetical protein